MSSCVPTCVSLMATEKAPSACSQTSYYKGFRFSLQLNILPAGRGGRCPSHRVSPGVLPCLFHDPTSLPPLLPQTAPTDVGDAAGGDAARIPQPGEGAGGPVLRIPGGKIGAPRPQRSSPKAETSRWSPPRGLEAPGWASQIATSGAGPLRHRLSHRHAG